MGTTNNHIWTMPDGSTITTSTNTPPPGYIPPGPGPAGPQGEMGPQGPQGAAGAKGLDALPEAWDPRYGWANPYNQSSAPQAPIPQDTGYGTMPIAPGGGMNPIQLMSQFSGYGSPKALMNMQAGQLAPGQMRRRI